MELSERAVAEGVVEDVGDGFDMVDFNVDAKSDRPAPGMTMTAVESEIVIVPDDIGIRIVNVDETLEAGMDGTEVEGLGGDEV